MLNNRLSKYIIRDVYKKNREQGYNSIYFTTSGPEVYSRRCDQVALVTHYSVEHEATPNYFRPVTIWIIASL